MKNDSIQLTLTSDEFEKLKSSIAILDAALIFNKSIDDSLIIDLLEKYSFPTEEVDAIRGQRNKEKECFNKFLAKMAVKIRNLK
jgi:lipopolysaccharide biosynthesis glycosyltransferase